MEGFKAEIIKKEGCRLTLNIEIPPGRVAEEIESSYNKLKNKVNLRGFRRGKVPIDIIRQRFEEEAKGDAVERVIQDALSFAFREKEITPISPATIRDFKGKPELKEPISVTAEVEIAPEIKIGKYNKLKLIRETKTINEIDVQKSLDMLREKNAELLPIDREISEEKDHVIIDYNGFEEGNEKEVIKGRNQLFAAGEEDYLGGFCKHLVGLKKNEESEFNVEFPKDYFEKELTGKKINFKVTVRGIKNKVLPELDDNFAKNLGEESFESLKNKIRLSLEAQEKRRSEEKLRSDLIEKLIEISSLELPPSLVERQLEYLLESHRNTYKKQKGELEQTEKEGLIKKYRPVAEKQVKVMLILNKIAEDEKIDIKKEEIESEKEKAIQRSPERRKELERYFDQHLDEIQYRLKEGKIFDFLFKNAKIKSRYR